jgi:porphobilinogen synthase
MSRPDSFAVNELQLKGASPLRATVPIRSLLNRKVVGPERIIAALLVKNRPDETNSLPVVTEVELPSVARDISSRGIAAIKLFVDSYAPSRDAHEVFDSDGLSPRSISAIKSAVPNLCIITDTCLCSYTTDGACALTKTEDGSIDEKATFERLTKLAENQVKAGADIVGPAPMMSGAVAAIRHHLDALSFGHVPLMPHLSWRSSLYRAYRSAMSTGDGSQRQAFQIDTTRPEQFIETGKQLKEEGANLIQVQPGLFSLDLVQPLRESLNIPIALYSVSGEFLMMKKMSSSEDEFQEILLEHASVCLRGAADFLVTYAWKELTSK